MENEKHAPAEKSELNTLLANLDDKVVEYIKTMGRINALEALKTVHGWKTDKYIENNQNYLERLAKEIG